VFNHASVSLPDSLFFLQYRFRAPNFVWIQQVVSKMKQAEEKSMISLWTVYILRKLCKTPNMVKSPTSSLQSLYLNILTGYDNKCTTTEIRVTCATVPTDQPCCREHNTVVLYHYHSVSVCDISMRLSYYKSKLHNNFSNKEQNYVIKSYKMLPKRGVRTAAHCCEG
jgi:hypothetical protein